MTVEAATETVGDVGETRLNVRLSAELVEALDWIAAQKKISRAEAIRRAVGTEKFFTELQQQDARFFVQMPDAENLKEVIFTLR